jgi:hypothetical protein
MEGFTTKMPDCMRVSTDTRTSEKEDKLSFKVDNREEDAETGPGGQRGPIRLQCSESEKGTINLYIHTTMY